MSPANSSGRIQAPCTNREIPYRTILMKRHRTEVEIKPNSRRSSLIAYLDKMPLASEDTGMSKRIEFSPCACLPPPSGMDHEHNASTPSKKMANTRISQANAGRKTSIHRHTCSRGIRSGTLLHDRGALLSPVVDQQKLRA